LFDIFSGGFGRALDRFGGDRQTGQQFHLLAAPIEGSFMAHGGQHTADPRGEFRVLDVEIDIHGKLALMAMLTEVIRAQALGFTDSGQHGLGT